MITELLVFFSFKKYQFASYKHFLDLVTLPVLRAFISV